MNPDKYKVKLFKLVMWQTLDVDESNPMVQNIKVPERGRQVFVGC